LIPQRTRGLTHVTFWLRRVYRQKMRGRCQPCRPTSRSKLTRSNPVRVLGTRRLVTSPTPSPSPSKGCSEDKHPTAYPARAQLILRLGASHVFQHNVTF
jgi:hypothetical protein